MEACQTAEDVKEEVMDLGFVEVDSDGVHQLCTACLCTARTTHTLDDVTLKQYYMNILTETQVGGTGRVSMGRRQSTTWTVDEYRQCYHVNKRMERGATIYAY